MAVKKRQAVFIDKDGVINDLVDRGDNFFSHGKKVRWTAPFNYQEFKIKPGAAEAMRLMGEMGFLRIVVTNQPDITYGDLSPEELEKMFADIRSLPVDDIFVCTHGRNDGCVCKKPKPGLFLAADKKWSVDFLRSYIVGDTENDILPGGILGTKTILVSSVVAPHTIKRFGEDFSCRDLLAAAKIIKERETE